jgi:hypothetical protein
VLTVCSLRQPGHAYSLASPNEYHQRIRSAVQHQQEQQPQQQRQRQQGCVNSAESEAEIPTVNSQSASKKVPDIQFGLLNSVSPIFTFTASGSSSPLRALVPATKSAAGAVCDGVKVPGTVLNHADPTTDNITKGLQRLQVESQVCS